MRWGWFGVMAVVSLLGLGPLPAPGAAPSSQATRMRESNPTLDRADALLTGGKWKAAHDLLVPWVKSHPIASDRDRALYLLAQAYYQGGERFRAFYQLDELLDTYPDSRLFYPALELQYTIADGYLNGFKNRDPIFGLAVVSAEDEAIEMLFRIQERSPGSPLAEKSLLRTADYYFNSSQFDLAGDAYGAFLHSYPRSPSIPSVRLRQAFSSLAQFRGPRFDATPLIDARAQFKDVQARYPDLAADANVPQWIERIDADLARKAYITGDYYVRTHHEGGAAFMFRYVIQTYPGSHEATLSRAALAKLPRWATDQPAPPPSNPEAAATQPGAGPLTPRRPNANEKPR